MDNVCRSEWFLLMALLVHLLIAPFTKVEESFNIQAIHDILHYQTNISQYDHREFPGVVPRTFFGSLFVSSILMPLLPIFNFFNIQKIWLLFASRFIVGFCVILAFCNLCRCFEKRFDKTTGTFLRIITISQFHFMFYASRTLPNIFALILVLWAYQKFFDSQYKGATILATIATFLFRFELVILFGVFYLALFAKQRYSPFKAIIIGIFTALVVLGVTIPIDSYFWNRWVWPEGEVLWFNIVLNRSNEYGVYSFWWYFTSVLPRALLTTLVIIPLGFLFERRALSAIVLPALSFIVIYSFLPHKELRFIIYVFPLLNLSAAVFCSKLWNSKNKSFFRKCVAYMTILHLLVNILMSSIFLYASAKNYPGGNALAYLQFLFRYKNKPMSIHIDTFCAETGINRFLHMYSNWEYNKTENLPHFALERFDFLLFHSKTIDQRELLIRNFSASHKELFFVEAFQKLHFKPNKLFFYLPTIQIKKKVIVLQKRNMDNLHKKRL